MKQFLTSSCRGAQNFFRLAAFTIAASIFAGHAAAQPVYSVQELGVLPGMSGSVANNLNDRGDVVGHCVPATITGLLPKDLYSMATAINSSGVVVGDGDTGCR